MRPFLLLLGVRFAGERNRLRRLSLRDLPGEGATLFVFLGLAVGMFLLTRSATSYLLNEAHVGLFLLHRFLSMIIYIIFLTVNLSNLIVSYATLYRSGEVAYLLTLPIPHPQVALVKFIDNFVASSGTLFLVFLAVFFGYASVMPFPWYFYPFSVLAIHLPLMVLASVTALTVLIALVTVAFQFGVRRLLALAMVVYLAAVYGYFALTHPMETVSEVMKHFPDVNAYFGAQDPGFMLLLPNHWVTEYLYWLAVGSEAGGSGYLLLLSGAAAGALVLAWWVTRRFFYRSWLAVNSSPEYSASPFPGTWLRPLAFGRGRIGSSQVDAFVKRDFWMFFRDPGQWVHLFLMAILMLAFLATLATLEIPMRQPAMKAAFFLTLILFNGFLVSSAALRFVFPAVSQEGEAFWIIRSAPVRLERLYRWKFVAASGLVLGASLVLATGVAGLTHQSIPLLLVCSVTMGSIAVTITSMHLGAGAVYAMYQERNPVRVSSSRGAAMTFLFSILYLLVVIGFLAVPIYRYYVSEDILLPFSAHTLVLPLVAVVLFSMAITLVANSFGIRSFTRND